jgi:hypothetical protein
MATNFFNTKWSDRAPLEKTVLLAGTVTLSIIVLTKSKKWAAAWKARQAKKTYSGDLDILTYQGQKPTYLDSQYVIFANSLYEAMNSSAFNWGTDEDSVQGIMYRMKNDVDVNKLITAFDRKDGDDLSAWITGDFSVEDKEYYINKPLRSHNIKYQF